MTHVTRPRVALALLLVAALLAATTVTQFRGWRDAGITHGDRSRPQVALTFDDGLNAVATARIAAILERYEARGTFFVLGETLEVQTPLAAGLVERGHVLASHTHTHSRARVSDLRYATLTTAQAAFEAHLGRCPRYARPPYGAETAFTKAAVRRAGMRTVLWDVEVADWSETDPARLAANVLAKVQPGSIVLLHDGSEGAVGTDRSVLRAALPLILDGLRARGLQPVTLDALLGTSAYIEC